MQQWEYMFVTPDSDRGVLQPRYVNDGELRDWKKGPSISQFANQLGEKGWELVAVTVTSNTAGGAVWNRYYFKRPTP